MPRRAVKPSADRILAAAEQVFATKGYGDVSLRQLIAAAGVSTTAFYARFDSVDAVLTALSDRLFAGLRDEAAEVLPRARNLAEGIDAGIEVLCVQLASRKPLVRLVIAETGSVAPMTAARQKSYRLLVGFLAHYLRALATRRRIDCADPDATAWALVGALEMQVVRWAVWDDIDIDELRTNLAGVARAVLPKEHP